MNAETARAVMAAARQFPEPIRKILAEAEHAIALAARTGEPKCSLSIGNQHKPEVIEVLENRGFRVTDHEGRTGYITIYWETKYELWSEGQSYWQPEGVTT